MSTRQLYPYVRPAKGTKCEGCDSTLGIVRPSLVVNGRKVRGRFGIHGRWTFVPYANALALLCPRCRKVALEAQTQARLEGSRT